MLARVSAAISGRVATKRGDGLAGARVRVLDADTRQHLASSTTGEQGEFRLIEESGLRFWVNFSDYLDTGLFLDHRITRQRLRDAAARKRFLNLFAYTGSATVYAAAGRARVRRQAGEAPDAPPMRSARSSRLVKVKTRSGQSRPLTV